jgi:hypothetical protein
MNLIERALRTPPGWNMVDEPLQLDDEPAMEQVDMEPASNGVTGGWQPWGIRWEFRDGLGALDAPLFIARGGIAVEDGCARITEERECDEVRA